MLVPQQSNLLSEKDKFGISLEMFEECNPMWSPLQEAGVSSFSKLDILEKHHQNFVTCWLYTGSDPDMVMNQQFNDVVK